MDNINEAKIKLKNLLDDIFQLKTDLEIENLKDPIKIKHIDDIIGNLTRIVVEIHQCRLFLSETEGDIK